MAEIPQAIVEYLSTGDGVRLAELRQQYPELPQQLRDPAVRRNLLALLDSPAVRADPDSDWTAALLRFLRTDASPAESPLVRPFLTATSPMTRLRAFEFLVFAHFGDQDRTQLLTLLKQMLMDPDDMVRAQAAEYVQRAGATQEL